MNTSNIINHGLLLFPVISLLLLLSGCGMVGSDNDDFEGARFHLSMDTTEVEAGGKFTAVYSVENTSSRALEIETGCIELAGIGVYQDDEFVEFTGADITCRTAMGYYEVEPRQTLTIEWDMHAFTLTREPGETAYDTTFASPGIYTLMVFPYVNRINGTLVNPDTEQIEFQVN